MKRLDNRSSTVPERSVSVPFSKSKTESKSKNEKGIPLSAESGTPSVRTRVNPKEKAAVIAAVAKALKAGNYPSMDVRLKNIVASQIGDLIRGGFELEDIRRTAIELGLSWDETRGHNRLCHLSSRVRAAYWSAERKKHDAAMAGGMAPDVMALMPDKSMGDRRFIHPNNHAFVWDSSTSCRICGGPPGVHVRRVEVA